MKRQKNCTFHFPYFHILFPFGRKPDRGFRRFGFREDGREIFRLRERRTSSTREQRKRDGKKGAEGCAVSSRMYAARVIPRDVYSARSGEATGLSLLEITSPECQRECKRGSALAYCLKLLIGLRSDTAFPRYAVFLPLSLSFSFPLCVSLSLFLPNPPSTFPLSFRICLLCPASTSSMSIVDDARPSFPNRGNEEGAPGCCIQRSNGISAVHSANSMSTFF